MTEDEARLFLRLPEGEDLSAGQAGPDEAYEDALFEIRKFLLSKPVLLKTFQSKQTRLKQLHTAFLTLGGTEPMAKPVAAVDFTPSENVLEHFSHYHAAKNELKRRLSTASGQPEMDRVINELIALERLFVQPFAAYTDWTTEEVLVSREADSVEIIRQLRQQQENGAVTLEALYKNRVQLPAELLRELKRLSLHQNYLYDE